MSNLSSNPDLHRHITTSSNNGTERQLDPAMASQMYQQQQQQHLSGMDARLFSHNVPSTTSPFQQYGNPNVQYPPGMGDIGLGMGVGMEDMIGKWMDGVDGGMLQNGLSGALAVGQTGPLSNLAAAAGYLEQQHAGGMSQEDRQAWLAQSIFGGHQQGESLSGMGNAGMGMFGGMGQNQFESRQQYPGSSRGPHNNLQTYDSGTSHTLPGHNQQVAPFAFSSMYGNLPQFGQSSGGMENPMKYRDGDFDLANMNAALAGMQLGLGEQGRVAGIANTGAEQGPPSTSSGRGSMNSGSAPGTALSQLSGGSAGTGITSLSSGSGSGLAVGNERDDLIPTAIVIKNIPFDVVKEKMLEVIVS
jgi:hypothetical protein